MSQQTGVAAEKLQEFSYAAELVDVPLSTLATSMARNVKSMDNARDGSKRAAAAYRDLGVEITNTDGSLRNSEDVFWEIVDALGQVENGTERDAYAMASPAALEHLELGRKAQDLNPLF